MNRCTLLGNLVNLRILYSLQGRVQRGSARIYTFNGQTRNIEYFLPARINSGIKDIKWLQRQELVSPWDCAATSVGGEARSLKSAAANRWGGGGSQG